MSLTPYRDALVAVGGLVGAWGLSEPSGNFADIAGVTAGVLTDLGGFNDPVRAEASLLPNGEGASLHINRHSNSSGQYVNIPRNANQDVGDVFSIVAWVKPETRAADECIFARFGANAGDAGPELRFNASGTLLVLKNNVSGIVSATSNMSSGTVYHVAYTKNGATSKLYLNAVDVTGTVTNATMQNNTSDCRIGARPNNLATDDFYDGNLQYVSFHSIALSSADITTLYNAGSTALSADPSGPTPRGPGQQVPSGFERSAGGTGLLIPRTRN